MKYIVENMPDKPNNYRRLTVSVILFLDFSAFETPEAMPDHEYEGDIYMRSIYFVLAAILWSTTAVAQTRMYGTSGMDRGQAGVARLQAQQAASADAIEAIAQCGTAGRIYGPGFSGAKSGNCPNNFAIRAGGGIAVTGGASISGATTVTGNASVTGTLNIGGAGTFGNQVKVTSGGLNVSGVSTFSDNLTVGGTTTATDVVNANAGLNARNGWIRVYGNYGLNFADHGGGLYMSDDTWLRSYGDKSIYTGGDVRADGQFQIGSSVFGPPPVCDVNTQKLYWNDGWTCKATIGGAGAGETDPTVGILASGKWCYSNGTQVICDRNAPTANAFISPPACDATDAKLRWTGTTWECVTEDQTGGLKLGQVYPTAPNCSYTYKSGHHSWKFHVPIKLRSIGVDNNSHLSLIYYGEETYPGSTLDAVAVCMNTFDGESFGNCSCMIGNVFQQYLLDRLPQ